MMNKPTTVFIHARGDRIFFRRPGYMSASITFRRAGEDLGLIGRDDVVEVVPVVVAKAKKKRGERP